MNLLEGFQIGGSQGDIDLPYSSQRVLAFLAVQTRWSSRTWVASALWDTCSEARASANLRSALWRIKRSSQQLVNAETKALRLAPEIDVDLRCCIARAHQILRQDVIPEPPGLGELIEVGEVLPGWYDDWVIAERERFRQLRLHALEKLCERLAQAGRYGEAVEAGLAAVSGEPLRESAHRALIEAHLLEGNLGEALHQYDRCAEVLKRELGVNPSPSTQELIKRRWPLERSG